MKRLLPLYLAVLMTIISCTPQTKNEIPNIQTLIDDGAWCWFSNPRAIYTGNNIVITGWVKKDGSVEAASLNLSTGGKQTKILYPQLEPDDHDNPAFATLPNGNVLAIYTWHSKKNGVIMNTTAKGSDVGSFGPAEVFRPADEKLLQQFPRETFTYANPFVQIGRAHV